MCYAIPGKITNLSNGVATIDYFGEEKNAFIEGQTLKRGDYVFVQAGLVIQKIPHRQALSTLAGWKKTFEVLKKRDVKLAPEPNMKRGGMDGGVSEIIDKAKKGKSIDKEEAIQLMNLKNPEQLSLLYSTANFLRRKYSKNSCCIHGIIEFSNYCTNNCKYCGIRKSNEKLARYRMSVKEIVTTASYAVNKLGFKALVLQSGEDPWFTCKKLAEVVERVREKCPAVIFVSVGEAGEEAYEEMYEAGARGALIRFETSNEELYERLHEGQPLKERLACIRYARKLGYLIATGSLIGLLGQTNEDLVNDIFLTKALDAEMYSFGPLVPHPDTHLGRCTNPRLDAVLKVLAVSRFVDPRAKILVTTALETLAPEGRKRGFLAGAGSCMIDVTPAKYRVNYQLYPGKASVGGTDLKKYIAETVALLYSLGRAPTDFGVNAT